MARINWTESPRTRRVSASALALLDALSAPHTRLALSLEGGGAQGIYHFSNGDGAPQYRVLGRTVEALLGSRLIRRDGTAEVTYVIASAGLKLLAQRDRHFDSE